MYLINKSKTFVHVGIEADDTAMTLPAGLYDVTYNHMQSASVFTSLAGSFGPYYDLRHPVQDDIHDEIEYFFAQDGQRGLLVHGGPGNGKTRMLNELIARACTAHNAVALIGPDIDHITRFIEAVRADDPDRRVIVFWDEFDEIVDNDTHSVLRFLDGGKSQAGVLTVAALNDLDELDDRVYKRPGRFGLVAELQSPDATVRHRLLSNFFSDPDVIAGLVFETEGLSVDYVREIAHRITRRGQTLPEIRKKLALIPTEQAA